MKVSLGCSSLLVSLLGLLPIASLATAQVPAQAKPDSTRTYSVVTKGLVGGPIYSVGFRSARLRIDERNLIMGPGSADSVPIPTRVIMELRGGTVTATVNGTAHHYVQGDFWVVEPGSHLALENRGDAVVIRALYLHEGAP